MSARELRRLCWFAYPTDAGPTIAHDAHRQKRLSSFPLESLSSQLTGRRSLLTTACGASRKVAIASQGGMNPVFQAGALLHEQRSHPRQLPAGNPILGQGAGILQNEGGTSPSLPWSRFYYPDRILPVDAKEAADDEGFVVLPDGALRLAGPIGREADIADILATREGAAGAFGVFRIEIVPQSGPPAHIRRGEEEFFSLLKGEFNFKLGERLVRAPTR